MVFLDGNKNEYIDYYNKLYNKLKPGGIIIADNVLWNGKIIDNVLLKSPLLLHLFVMCMVSHLV